MDNDIIVSILSIIFGIIIMVFPYLGITTVSVIIGLAFIFMGLSAILFSFTTSQYHSRLLTVPGLIIGILLAIFGVFLLFDAGLFATVLSIFIYIAGIFLIILGILGIVAAFEPIGKTIGIVGLIIGIIYIAFGYFISDPATLGFLIGLGLLIMGAVNLLTQRNY